MQGVPAGFEDFVRSHHDLLAQFQDMSDAAKDEVTFFIYPLSAGRTSEASQVEAMIRLKKRIDDLLGKSIDQYQWNNGKLDFSIAISNGHPCHLKGVVDYGNNVEDEWYIVYLFQVLTLAIDDIAISIHDTDGEFLLIEAAEHLDSWVGPENTEHRVWIHKGKIHIIPLEVAGRTSGGVNLFAALACLASDVCTEAGAAVQRTIDSRTKDVYPAKALAHQHHAASILPFWAANLFVAQPDLISLAVNQFSSVDHDDLSKAVNGISLPIPNPHSPALVSQSIRMTRTLYAQLTFKKFKTPRKLHHLMRVVSGASSAKVMKSFEFGCRLVCGLLLALQRQEQEEPIREEVEARNAAQAAIMAAELRLSGDARLIVETDAMVEDELALLLRARSTSVRSALQRLYSDLADEEARCESAEHRATVWQDILKDRVRNDSDAWMYLDPDQLDAEMKARMEAFRVAHEADESVEQTTPAPQAPTVPNPQPHASPSTPSSQGLQEVVDGFKSFFSQESDYEGIKTRQGRSVKVKAITVEKEEEAGGGAGVENNSSAVWDLSSMSLDLNYIDQIVNSALERPAASAAPMEGGLVDEAFAGRAVRELTRSSTSADEDGDNEPDSDDEDSEEGEEEDGAGDDEDDESALDSDDEIDGPRSHGDGDEEDVENEADEDMGDDVFREYEVEMDSQLLQEGALRATFAELQQLRREAGLETAASCGPSDMDDEEMDMHMLINLMQSHAEGLGMPQGPVHALLSQLGVQLPIPPPMSK